jgi:hypothetical protein
VPLPSFESSYHCNLQWATQLQVSSLKLWISGGNREHLYIERQTTREPEERPVVAGACRLSMSMMFILAPWDAEGRAMAASTSRHCTAVLRSIPSTQAIPVPRGPRRQVQCGQHGAGDGGGGRRAAAASRPDSQGAGPVLPSTWAAATQCGPAWRMPTPRLFLKQSQSYMMMIQWLMIIWCAWIVVALLSRLQGNLVGKSLAPSITPTWQSALRNASGHKSDWPPCSWQLSQSDASGHRWWGLVSVVKLLNASSTRRLQRCGRNQIGINELIKNWFRSLQ